MSKETGWQYWWLSFQISSWKHSVHLTSPKAYLKMIWQQLRAKMNFPGMSACFECIHIPQVTSSCQYSCSWISCHQARKIVSPLFKVRMTRFLNTSVMEQYFHMLKFHDFSISLASSGATGQECILSRVIALLAILVGGCNILWRVADSRRRRKTGGKGKVSQRHEIIPGVQLLDDANLHRD